MGVAERVQEVTDDTELVDRLCQRIEIEGSINSMMGSTSTSGREGTSHEPSCCVCWEVGWEKHGLHEAPRRLVRWDVGVAEREWPYHPWIVGRQDELNKCLTMGRYIAQTVVVLDETSRRVRWDVGGSRTSH